MSKQYDVLVIGSGTAGQTAAYELNRQGLTVGMVEHSQEPGGTCVLSGCQAKKWFYEGTETVARSRHLPGIGITSPAFASWVELRDAKNRFTKRVPDKTVNGLKKACIDFIRGRARFTDRRSIAVLNQQLSARFIVVATGAVPMQLPIDGAQLMVTSTEFMELERLPRRIVFIGGGFISFEFAHFAVRLGPTDTCCTILEAGPRPLGPFDQEMVDLLGEASASEGIDIHCDVDIIGIEKADGEFFVTTKDGRRFDSDLVVHGAGRSADIDDPNLEKPASKARSAGLSSTRQWPRRTPMSMPWVTGGCRGPGGGRRYQWTNQRRSTGNFNGLHGRAVGAVHLPPLWDGWRHGKSAEGRGCGLSKKLRQAP